MTTELDNKVESGIDSEKWKKVGKFFLGLNSKRFYVTTLIILFEAFIVYLFFLIIFKAETTPKLSVEDYLKVVSAVHLFLLPIILWWFGTEERKNGKVGKNGD